MAQLSIFSWHYKCTVDLSMEEGLLLYQNLMCLFSEKCFICAFLKSAGI